MVSQERFGNDAVSSSSDWVVVGSSDEEAGDLPDAVLAQLLLPGTGKGEGEGTGRTRAEAFEDLVQVGCWPDGVVLLLMDIFALLKIDWAFVAIVDWLPDQVRDPVFVLTARRVTWARPRLQEMRGDAWRIYEYMMETFGPTSAEIADYISLQWPEIPATDRSWLGNLARSTLRWHRRSPIWGTLSGSWATLARRPSS